jgi:hypothetical protein
MNHDQSPTLKQMAFVRSLQRQLHLTDAALDTWCVQQFGQPLARVSRSNVSTLLDDMQLWQGVPAELRRAMGQLDLVPMEDTTS